ncbi:hypothetical protein J7K27_07980 [Candidatus Bathyarchaeota archaeon]|nr:hypothetical protein [Candidatus Bathyarchaeota archaeon]
MSTDDLAIIESNLKGKTLLVYWYMLRQPDFKAGVREIQRSLGFSSPSIALHHLNKLIDLGLVEKTKTGEYVLVQEVKVGILRFFARIGRFLIPRYLFYSVFFTTALVLYILLYAQTLCIHNFFALVFGGLASTILWIETFRIMRERPF